MCRRAMVPPLLQPKTADGRGGGFYKPAQVGSNPSVSVLGSRGGRAFLNERNETMESKRVPTAGSASREFAGRYIGATAGSATAKNIREKFVEERKALAALGSKALLDAKSLTEQLYCK